jgi:hypothetical protein
MIKRLLAILLLVFACFVLDAQNIDGKSPFHMSLRATGTVPHPLGTNKAFKRSFTGIYDVSLFWNYQVFRGFQIGVGYRHNLWKTPDNKIPGLNTYAQSHHGGLRVGYDRVMSETSVAYCGISAMMGKMHFYGISYEYDSTHVPLQTKFEYRTIEADAGVFFYTEGNFAIGIHAAAIFTNFAFDPDKLYLDQHKAYIASDYEGKVSHLNVGFSLVYSFWKSKNAGE